MIDQNFIYNARLTDMVMKDRIKTSNQLYSTMVETHIRGHPDYHKLHSMRQTKEMDRKATAKYQKQLLKESLERMGMTLTDFDNEFKRRKSADHVHTHLLELEEHMFKEMKPLLKEVPVFWWLEAVKGIGIRYSTKLLWMIGDITRFRNPSALRKYCGTVPGQRRRRGQEANFNPALKGVLLGQVAGNFLKNKSQYKAYYDRKKAKYAERYADELLVTEQKKEAKAKITKDDWTKARIDNYSRKAMINRFLVDLWKAAFLVIGEEPPTNPYILNDPKHNEEPMLVPVTPQILKKVEKWRRKSEEEA
jgi:hypothetical protein